jgi:DHA1 family bicyclomycin/chloramphenicol resistance-like MFS transporter
MDDSIDIRTDDAPEEQLLGAAFDRPLSLPGTFPWSVRWLILLLGTMSALGPLAIDMYLPAFPTIAAEFHVGVAEVERTLAVYFIGLSLGQLVYGPASDRFGRKRPLYFGLIMFIIASAGCALAASVHQLMAMRLLQALGGCAEMVVARAIVRDRFDTREAARVYSSLMLVMGLAPILAPLIGGWLIVHIGWRSIFVVHVLVASVCLFNVAFFLQESLPPERRDQNGFMETAALYGRLLGHRTFMGHTLSVSLMCGGLFAYVGGSPFVIIQLFGVRPEHFGYYFGLNAAGLITASQINGRLAHHFSLTKILRSALIAAAAAGSVLLFDALTHLGGFAGILMPLFFFVSSLGFVFPTATSLALAPHGRNAGNASAVLGCVQFLLSGLSGMLVSALDNGTAAPMCGLIAAGGIAAMVINLFMSSSEPEDAVTAVFAE